MFFVWCIERKTLMSSTFFVWCLKRKLWCPDWWRCSWCFGIFFNLRFLIWCICFFVTFANLPLAENPFCGLISSLCSRMVHQFDCDRCCLGVFSPITIVGSIRVSEPCSGQEYFFISDGLKQKLMPTVSLTIPSMSHTVVLDEICAHMLFSAAPLHLLRNGAAASERPCHVDSFVHLCKKSGELHRSNGYATCDSP